MVLNKILAHPKLKDRKIDDISTTIIHREIIENNSFLNRIYADWYRLLADSLTGIPGGVLELGSGAGFLDQIIPELIKSDVNKFPFVDIVNDGQDLPFKNASLRGILMTNVLHHIPNIDLFFHEASRCVDTGGVISMIEPWNTKWSKFIYTHLHSEPFCPEREDWKFTREGRMSSANDALPWIVFLRDRDVFEKRFPEWDIECIQPMMPFRYLVSGGVSMRQLIPGWSYEFWTGIDALLSPWIENWAMFAFITLKKKL